MSELQYRLQKLAIEIPDIDPLWYYEQLAKFPEGEWFQPSNRLKEDYSLWKTLVEYNLVERKTSPIWENGAFKGLIVRFRYRLDLDYVTAEEVNKRLQA